jgi:hypothetical protein
MSDNSNEWYFCLRHKTVEQGPGCPNKDRMGPYSSSDEAAGALERAHKRTEEWDNDPKWSDE